MKADATIQFVLNGERRRVTTDPDRVLLEILREDLQLTGTKYGCGERQCGACSVLVDGQRAFACRTPASSVEGKAVTTIEGLAQGDDLHPVQEAFLAEQAYQCGYCTAGMIMTAVALLKEKPQPTDREIVDGLNRNICRCCSYPQIVQAVKLAAASAKGRA
ncbi:(2Fe-2S)-binding protein [Singulisphaera sp. PoT]|uniref:(2Fe-2S)-binding protein n=1 Tax=Singulisphaera sp. PoT TaxID=3411797 RepID=UPI003BF483DE